MGKIIAALLAIFVVVSTAVVIITTVPQTPKPIQRASADLDAVYPTFRVPTSTPWPTMTPAPTLDYQATEVIKAAMLLSAQQTIDSATAVAFQMTQDVRDTETARQATAEAQARHETAQAEQSTAAAMAALETQSAVGTATMQALVVLATERAMDVEAAAIQATKTAESTLFALQVADINFRRQSNQTQVALDLTRKEVTNTALAVSPYILGSIILTALVWLIVRFGQVEVNRRKLIEGLILDNKAGNLNVIKPGLMAAPAAISGKNITLQPVSPELQAETTKRAQLIEALKATNSTQTTAERSMKADAPAVITQVGKLLPESVDWKEINNRRPGQLLLGAGTDGAIFARTDTPHMLIAGTTGSGKSTAMRAVITQHLLDGRRVTILDKSGRDFGVFAPYANVITLDASQPDNAVNKLVAYLRAAWMEVLRRQHEARPTWKGVIDVLVVDELDNWQDIGTDTDTSGRRLWQYPRMISREGRASGVYLLAASQNPTAANISIDLRRNCTPVAFRLADSAASRVIIDTPDAVGLETGQFIARIGDNIRGMGTLLTDDNITQLLRTVKPQSRPEWLDAVDMPTLEVVEPAESWQDKAKRLKAEGMAVSRIAREIGRNYYDTQAALGENGVVAGQS